VLTDHLRPQGLFVEQERPAMATEDLALLQEALDGLRGYRRAMLRNAKNMVGENPGEQPADAWFTHLQELPAVQDLIEALKQALHDEREAVPHTASSQPLRL
jgi:hypothetical protein